MKARIKSADPEFTGDYLEIKPLEGPRVNIQVAMKVGRRGYVYSDITIDTGDLYRALKRAGIEIDTTLRRS